MSLLKLKRDLILLCLFLCAFTAWFIWYVNNKQVLSPPDQIIICGNDKTKVLDKNSKDFDKIVSLSNKRFPTKLEMYKSVVDNWHMSYIIDDGIGIEFIYSTEQSLSVQGKPIKYSKLYFQLTSKRFKDTSSNTVNIFQYGDKNNFIGSSIGTLNYSPELVELVKAIK